MSDADDDEIQFRGSTVKEAVQAVDEIRLGEIDVSDLAREGLRETLRRTISDEEKIEIHRRYRRGEISEDAAKVVLGDDLDDLDEIEREREAFEAAMGMDVDGVFQE